LLFIVYKPAERVVNEPGIYRPDLLPGFELPLSELLAAADKWSQTEQGPAGQIT
jgi:hypothetical protein